MYMYMYMHIQSTVSVPAGPGPGRTCATISGFRVEGLGFVSLIHHTPKTPTLNQTRILKLCRQRSFPTGAF